VLFFRKPEEIFSKDYKKHIFFIAFFVYKGFLYGLFQEVSSFVQVNSAAGTVFFLKTIFQKRAGYVDAGIEHSYRILQGILVFCPIGLKS